MNENTLRIVVLMIGWMILFPMSSGVFGAEEQVNNRPTPQGTRNIMLTGYWNPTGQMIAPFSTDPYLNPGGWKGKNWENRGYDIYSFFPNPGKYNGTFEVDYQNTWSDFWNITSKIRPIAIVSFGAGAGPWEIEFNARNLNNWVPDNNPPTQPTPNPPDSSKPVGFVRHSTLPVQEIADAVNAQSTINAWVDWNGNPGAYLCEYMAYLGMWYQDMHNSSSDPNYTAMAGFIHVANTIPVLDAMKAVNITLRVIIGALDGSGKISSNAGPLSRYWFNTSSIKIPYQASSQSNLTNLTLWYRFSMDNKTWDAWKPYTKINLTGNSTSGEIVFLPGQDGYYSFYTIANNTMNGSEPPPSQPDVSIGVDTTPPISSVELLPPYSKAQFLIKSTPSDSLSGILNLTLYYREKSGPWSVYSTLVKSPWEWQFIANHDGIYEFSTIAYDFAGNSEPMPPTNDTWTCVDSTPPAVIDTTPQNGDGDVPLEITITITFSETMNTQATEGALTADFGYTKSWNSMKTVISLTPDPRLEPGRQYHVSVGSGATDLAGNMLTPVEISFTTAASYQPRAWIVGCVRDEQGSPLEGVKVTISRDGTVNTTFTHSDGKYNITITMTGTYTIQFQKSGYQSVIRTITVTALQKEYETDVTLKPTHSSSSSEQTWIYIGILAMIILVAVLFALFVIMKRKRHPPAPSYPQGYYFQ